MKDFILGDCNEVLKSIPDNSINLFLEDMPYNTTACHWEYKVDLEQYWALRLSKLADRGCFVLTASQPFTTDLINSNRKMFKYELIWEKDKPSNFMLAKYQILKMHENILIFYNNQPTFIPQKTKRYDWKKRGAYRNNTKIVSVTNQERKIVDCTDNEKLEGSIIKFTRPMNVIHPTQKPVDLFRYLIKTYTNKDDTVFDGYAGSGTTAIACEMESRNYACVEMDKDYYEAAFKRLNQHKAQLTLFND